MANDIYLATDFSKYSEKATLEAKKIADALGVELKIIHIFDGHIQPPGPYHSMPGASSLWMKEYVDEARNKGKEALKELCEKHNVKESHFLEGDPAKTLVEFAKKEHVNFLVMGSHGYGILDRMLIGSVTDYVARHCDCSLLIVKTTDATE
ncbi:universal stress protein [Candidatus Uabimicrobium amorphum]|uniref:Universal stress protein n=1 Tax=Uabimicrobium amorphum TaxID=2596890 RepID=A0A5S9F2Y8_UABAM|nr:universal stress protein [Candidatus Uabimicrobium amorphum]BBM84185.1 Universal stress protein [Candidatus Uabimicrobium amorphum]